jgi:DNA-binding transcriptional MerR regulator
MSADEPGLTIGDLAERTGVAAATLRMWEARHGFPTPQRLDSGHRRYAERDVAAVRSVARQRDTGIRLEHAIARVLADAEPTAPSVYAVLRRRHPDLGVHRLRKSTLVALSWAIEDEFLSKADRATVWGAFQREEYYRPSAPRWAEIARVSAQTTVFADFGASDATASPRLVDLPGDAPMRREWAVVCDAVDLPAVLTAWELPGQDGVPDHDRVFESMWTVDGVAVQDAARVCAAVAASCGVGEETPTQHRPPGGPDAAAMTGLFNRMVAYVDRITG